MNTLAARAPRHRAGLATGIVTAVAGTLLALAPTPAEAAATANLRVTTATVDKTTVVEGAEDRPSPTSSRTAAVGKAGTSATRVYLTTERRREPGGATHEPTNPRSALTDVRLVGTAAVTTIAAGASRSVGATRFTVPAGIPAGDYRVLVCADDQGKVKESEEGDNCKAAANALAVTEAARTRRPLGPDVRRHRSVAGERERRRSSSSRSSATAPTR